MREVSKELGRMVGRASWSRWGYWEMKEEQPESREDREKVSRRWVRTRTYPGEYRVFTYSARTLLTFVYHTRFWVLA